MNRLQENDYIYFAYIKNDEVHTFNQRVNCIDEQYGLYMCSGGAYPINCIGRVIETCDSSQTACSYSESDAKQILIKYHREQIDYHIRNVDRHQNYIELLEAQ